MKRSEMVLKLAQYLKEYTSICEDRVEKHADELLALAEHFGMKPPVEEHCPVLFTPKHVWEKE